MIIDSSAVIAVLKAEPELEAIIGAVSSGQRRRMSTVTALECATAAGRTRAGLVEELLELWGVSLVPFDDAQRRLATQAFERYGPGSGSIARLNFGDCISYAAARHFGEPLLFKGNDFVHTDVESALG